MPAITELLEAIRDAVIAGGSSSSGIPVPVTLEKTRPGNTTPYAIGDAVGDTTNWTFPVARADGPGSGVIVGIVLATDDTINVSLYELDFYDEAIADIADNAEATQLYADIPKYLQTVPLPALAKKTTNSTASMATTTCAIPFDCVDGENVEVILRILTADTPVSAAKTSITLLVVQD
jgi:hypothetical protein